MPAITVKNIPETLYKHLKKSAETHRRSINSELIVCLEKVLTPQKINTDSILANAKMLRERIKGLNVTNEDLNLAKNEGRP